MAPAPTIRRPSRAGSYEHALARGETIKRGLKKDRYEEIIKTPRHMPAPLPVSNGTPILAGSRVVDIACGEFHSMLFHVPLR